MPRPPTSIPTAFWVTAGAVLSWAALIPVSRVVLLRLGLDPWAFSFVQLCAGGVVLLALAGRGRPDLSSFRRPVTWVLGVLRVLSAGFFTAVVAEVSVAEAGILGAVNVPMVALAVWLFFARVPGIWELPGHLVILAAIGPLIGELDGGFRHPAVLLMLANEVCLVLATLLAERHPDNVSDRSGARLRFTGAVLLVTAGLFLGLRLLQGWSLESVWDWRVLALGAAVGVFLRAPSMVLSFWSIRRIGAHNYIGAASALPLIGMGLEQAAVGLGVIALSRFQVSHAWMVGGVALGTLLVMAARLRAARYSAGAQPAVSDRDISRSTGA